MKQEVKQGQTDYTILILVRDTDGAPLTGLTNASAGIDVSYTRVETDNDVTITAGAVVALASPALTDPHLDWGFLEVDSTNAPGIYRFDMADGVFASGAWSSVVTLIATGADPTHIEFVLVPELPYVGVAATQAEADIAALADYDPSSDLVDGTITYQQAQAGALAVLTAKSTGGGLVFRDPTDTYDRVDATGADASGNRPVPVFIWTGLP